MKNLLCIDEKMWSIISFGKILICSNFTVSALQELRTKSYFIVVKNLTRSLLPTTSLFQDDIIDDTLSIICATFAFFYFQVDDLSHRIGKAENKIQIYTMLP